LQQFWLDFLCDVTSGPAAKFVLEDYHATAYVISELVKKLSRFSYIE